MLSSESRQLAFSIKHGNSRPEVTSKKAALMTSQPVRHFFDFVLRPRGFDTHGHHKHATTSGSPCQCYVSLNAVNPASILSWSKLCMCLSGITFLPWSPPIQRNALLTPSTRTRSRQRSMLSDAAISRARPRCSGPAVGAKKDRCASHTSEGKDFSWNCRRPSNAVQPQRPLLDSLQHSDIHKTPHFQNTLGAFWLLWKLSTAISESSHGRGSCRLILSASAEMRLEVQRCFHRSRPVLCVHSTTCAGSCPRRSIST